MENEQNKFIDARLNTDSYGKEDEQRKKLKDKGFSDIKINAFLNEKKREEQRKKLKDKGFSDIKINAFLNEKEQEESLSDYEQTPDSFYSVGEFNPTASSTSVEEQIAISDQKELDEAESITAAKRNNENTVFEEISALLGSEEDQKKLHDTELELVKILREQGQDAFIDTENDNQLSIKTKNGNVKVVDPSFIDNLYASKLETGVGIGGAVAGAVAGASLGSVVPVIGTTVGGIAGGLVGSFAGSSVGSGADYVLNLLKTKEKLEADKALNKMVSAGVADTTMTLITGGAFKLGGMALNGLGSNAAKILSNAYGAITNKSSQATVDYLYKRLDLSKEEAKKIVDEWYKLKTPEAQKKIDSMSSTDKEILAMLESHEKAGDIVREAVKEDGISMRNRITNTMKNIQKVSKGISQESVGSDTQVMLDRYVKEVSKEWKTIKDEGVNIMNETRYTFDLEDTFLEPLIDKIEGLVDENVLNSFTGTLSRISKEGGTRNFSELIELRKLYNSTKRKKNVADNRNATDIMNKALKSIDTEIKEATKKYMGTEKGADWVANFNTINKMYSEIKRMEDKIIYATTIKKGVTNEEIKKVIGETVPALDNEFLFVADRLPVEYVPKFEGSALNYFVDKYTKSIDSKNIAIDYVGLNKKLQEIMKKEYKDEKGKVVTTTGYEFKSKSAKQFVKMVEEYAGVLKNDPELSKMFDSMVVGSSGTALTTSAFVRAKFMFITKLFDYIRQFIPGETSKKIALIRVAGRLLENPLDFKTSKHFINEFPKDVDKKEIVDLTIKKFREDFASNKAKKVEEE